MNYMFVYNLDIHEFRGIKSCNGPIPFSNFTVLIGKNNSGKSTVLEALSLLPHPQILDVVERNNKGDTLTKLHSGSFSRLLYLYAGMSKLHYDLKRVIIDIEIVKNDFLIYAGGKKLQSKNDIAQFIGTDPKYLESYVIFFPSTTNILEKLETQLHNFKDLLTKQGLHIKLAEIINNFVNDKYTEIVFLSPISLRKVYENNRTAYICLSELGSGMEKVIKIMAFLEAFSPSLVIIDDFESGLHPTLIKGFLEWLKEKNWQTIVSTHSIDVLYHLIDIKPNNASILQLDKSNEDILNHKVLTLEELEDLLDSNTDPRLLLDALRL